MLVSVIIAAGLFLGLMAGLEIGRRIGQRYKTDKDGVGSSAADGVVFAVLGLIVAFTFSTSASRFNERRKLIVDQANALGTASLRLDALDAADRTAIRQEMLRWVQLADSLSGVGDDRERLNAVMAEGAQLQSKVWNLASVAVEKKQQPALWGFVMSPINDWTDLSSTRQAVDDLGTPPMVMPTVIALSLVSSLLAGFHMSQHPRSKLHYIAFAGIQSMLILVILDLNTPRSGLIRVDSIDKSMMQVEQSLKASLAGTDRRSP